MQHKDIAAVDLQGFSDKELSAIESEAIRRGVSFDEAVKQLLIEHARNAKAKKRETPIWKRYSFPGVH